MQVASEAEKVKEMDFPLEPPEAVNTPVNTFDFIPMKLILDFRLPDNKFGLF